MVLQINLVLEARGMPFRMDFMRLLPTKTETLLVALNSHNNSACKKLIMVLALIGMTNWI